MELIAQSLALHSQGGVPFFSLGEGSKGAYMADNRFDQRVSIEPTGRLHRPPLSKHKATPQLRSVEFSSSTNGPRSAPDPTVASGQNNPFLVTGAGE